MKWVEIYGLITMPLLAALLAFGVCWKDTHRGKAGSSRTVTRHGGHR